MAKDALSVVQDVYGAFGRGDIPAILGMLDEGVAWTSPRTLPQGGTYKGPGEVGSFFEKVVDFYTSAPELYTALHQARAADPEFAAAHRATMEANVIDWVRTDAMPGATEAQLRLAIAMMYTMVDSFMHLWLVDGWPLDRDAAIEAMTDALYSTMR